MVVAVPVGDDLGGRGVYNAQWRTGQPFPLRGLRYPLRRFMPAPQLLPVVKDLILGTGSGMKRRII
jgi:hypothetical protein